MEKKGRFVSGKGQLVEGWEAVVPIFRADAPPKLRCIGTGFFINVGGILVTAAHVVNDVLEDQGKVEAGLFALQLLPDRTIVRRDIINGCIHKRADVAVAAVRPLRHKETGAPLRNKVLVLTTRAPKVGDFVSTWSFPKTKHEITETTADIFVEPKHYDGFVSEEHRTGRDAVMLPGPCYETNLGIEGGASGGPVFDERGCVFGVNSTGLDGTDIAYVSHIQSIGGLSIKDVMTDDGSHHPSLTIHSLIERGDIKVNDDENVRLLTENDGK